MLDDLMQLLGGLGLFLLGMLVMTDGLRGLAGDYLHHLLARFTNGPLSGAATGAVTTAILQSSSATTVAAVGFVGAGLLTFPQALGVIFGANVGTTVTGWLVALLGLKLQVGALVFPLILCGALIRLFARGRTRHAGLAIAGFALIFLGITNLQQGMAAYQGLVTPADFPDDDLPGRLQLVAIGIAVTLITQSSSAGVATALTALYTGTILFPQAAAMVIGMNVGTTVTAAFATLGGSVDTRRTGYSHVVHNLLTAMGALLLLAPYTWLWAALGPEALERHAEIALVGFHTLFNLVGVVVVLPFAARFAAMMCRLVPAPKDPVLDRLDRRLLQNPAVALDNVAQILDTLTREVFGFVAGLLNQVRPAPAAVQRVARHLDGVQAFVGRIHLRPEQTSDWRRLNAAIHLLDHLQRLHERCAEEPERALNLAKAPALSREATKYREVIQSALTGLRTRAFDAAIAAAAAASARLSEQDAGLRAAIMSDVATGMLNVSAGTRRLQSVRWLRRGSYHVWRACTYLSDLAMPRASPPADAERRSDSFPGQGLG